MAYMVKRPGGLGIQMWSREEIADRAARGVIGRDWLVRPETGGTWELIENVFDLEWPAASAQAVAAAEPASLPTENANAESSLPSAAGVSAALPPSFPRSSSDGARSSATAAPSAQERWTKSAIKRYRDAYRVAAFVVGVGNVVKTLALVVGLILALLGLVASGSGGPGVLLGFAGMFFGALLGGAFFIWGIAISAHGQALRAQLDVAVYESPFLTDADRAAVMSL